MGNKTIQNQNEVLSAYEESTTNIELLSVDELFGRVYQIYQAFKD